MSTRSLALVAVVVGLGMFAISKLAPLTGPPPATASPEAEWVPVVNLQADQAGGIAPAGPLYRVGLKDGSTCFLYRGPLFDRLDCVR